MKRYFVTGSSGFIGTNIVEKLRSDGSVVLGFDIKAPRIDDHRLCFVRGSLLDKESLRATLLKFSPTHVIHMGARTDLEGRSLEDYRENIEGINNLIECCDETIGLERVVFASSRLVCAIGYVPKNYDDYAPTTAYGASKVRGEKIVKNLEERSWDWCIVRPTSIWGEWFGVPYRNFFDLIRSGKYFHPAGLIINKSFGFVGNVVHEVLTLASADTSKVAGKCFYVGDYAEIEVATFAKQIAKEFGVRAPIEVPLSLLHIAAFVGDILLKIGIRFPLTTFRLQNLITPMPHNFDDLRAVVGELPYTTGQGIERTVAWIKEHGND